MRENEPEQYKAYLEKMRIYLKTRRDKLRELKNSKKLKIQKYINNFLKNTFIQKKKYTKFLLA